MNDQVKNLHDKGERAFRAKRVSPNGGTDVITEVCSGDQLSEIIADFAEDLEEGRYVGKWQLVIELWDEHTKLEIGK